MTWYDHKELVVQAAAANPTQPEFAPVDLDDEAIRIVNDHQTVGFYIPRALGADELAESQLEDEAYDWDAIDEPTETTATIAATINAVAAKVQAI